MNFLKSISSHNNTQNGESGMQLNNVEILYTKVQRIYVKPQHKEERQRDLRVNVEIHSGISPVCQKNLCILLADDDDPCFLYSLYINEDDFKMLKVQQGLLVDFDNFATQLIYLLEQCYVSGSSGLKSNPPKFLLLLTEENGEWILKFLETNNFKHLCHLSLSISQANDNDVKTHMAMSIKKLKDELMNKTREATNMETRLNAINEELENRVREFESLQQKFLSERSQLEMTTSHQLSIEKDRLLQAKLEWERQSEHEKLEVERRHSEIVKQLHTELAEVRAQNMTYKDKQSFLEATNKEQSRQLMSLEKDLSVAQRDLAQIRKQNSKLDIDYHDKEKLVNELRMKVAVLEQDLKDKAILINKHSEMWKSAKEQKQQLEDLLSEKENHLQRKQNALKNVGDEVMKANEIIKKLQNELSTVKSKLKLRTSICLEQEKLLDTKQKEVGQLETKLEEHVKEMKDLKAEIVTLKRQLNVLQSQVDEKDKTIKNNDNVISWLNRRLADTQSPHQAVATPLPMNVPSNFQLTLPRTNKMFTHKTPMTASSLQHSSIPLTSGPTLRTGNMNSVPKISPSRQIGATADNTAGPTAFGRPGQISSTSTPMERMNIYHKLPNQALPENTTPNIINEDNNQMPLSNGGKAKSHSANVPPQGGLRRAVLDKPLLPSAYFPKPS